MEQHGSEPKLFFVVVAIACFAHPAANDSVKCLSFLFDFDRGDISSLSPFRLASFSTLSRCGAQLNVGVMSTPRYL